jgi:hypothetical protein
MSPDPLAARADAQTPTGRVVVVADMSHIGDSSALPDDAWIAVRIHHGSGGMP